MKSTDRNSDLIGTRNRNDSRYDVAVDLIKLLFAILIIWIVVLAAIDVLG